MEKITAFFDTLDFTKAVPEMDALLQTVQTVTSVAVLIGPVIMLLLGLWYFFLPPKEANHRAGFRTWFGMGSVEAWLFTQKVAGIVLGSLGLILTVVMGIFCLGFKSKELMDVVNTAFMCLLWQVVLAAVAYLSICVITIFRYDSKGLRRK